jgi:hypothetical protein
LTVRSHDHKDEGAGPHWEEAESSVGCQ